MVLIGLTETAFLLNPVKQKALENIKIATYYNNFSSFIYTSYNRMFKGKSQHSSIIHVLTETLKNFTVCWHEINQKHSMNKYITIET